MTKICPHKVAGLFYPSDPKKLSTMIDDFFKHTTSHEPPLPFAVIAPHAGYIYSGRVAAKSYSPFYALHSEQKLIEEVKRIVILAPSHRESFNGIAAPSYHEFQTPIGNVTVDQDEIARLIKTDMIQNIDQAYDEEHSIEVHLPFIRTLFPFAKIVPLLTGRVSSVQIEKLVESYRRADKDMIVVSSDLSHYNDYATAKKLDQITADAILNKDQTGIAKDAACGREAIQALVQLAKKRKMQIKMIDLCNSGDVGKNLNWVVGYGAFHFYEKELIKNLN